jgi:hypothetical protein
MYCTLVTLSMTLTYIMHFSIGQWVSSSQRNKFQMQWPNPYSLKPSVTPGFDIAES